MKGGGSACRVVATMGTQGFQVSSYLQQKHPHSGISKGTGSGTRL